MYERKMKALQQELAALRSQNESLGTCNTTFQHQACLVSDAALSPQRS